MTANKTKSEALQLLAFVWDHTERESWRRTNDAMQAALNLAMRAGMRFDVGDFKTIYGEFGAGWWIGEGGESAYCRAVEANNLTACRAFESWGKRKPFVARRNFTTNRDRSRLAVGHEFEADGETYKLTSFASGDSIVACTYYANDDYTRGKVKRRRTMTLAEFRETQKGKP